MKKINSILAAVLLVVLCAVFIAPAAALDFPPFDVFDWQHPGDRSEIARAVIETWKYNNENVDARFLNTSNLIDAINNYSGSWEQRLIFDIACEIAGVDFSRYAKG